MNRFIFLKILISFTVLFSCKKQSAEIDRIYVVDNRLFFANETEGKIFLTQENKSEKSTLQFIPDIIFNNFSYMSYDNSGIKVFHSSDKKLSMISNEEVVGISKDALFLYGFSEGFYIHEFFSGDSLLLKEGYFFEQSIDTKRGNYFLIENNDSLYFYNSKFEKEKAILISNKNYIYNKYFGLKMAKLTNQSVIINDKEVLSDLSEYDALLSFEIIRGKYFFLLKKDNAILLLNEQGKVLQEEKYRDIFFRIFYLDGSYSIGFKEGENYSISNSDKKVVEQLFYDGFEITIFSKSTNYELINTSGNGLIKCSEFPNINLLDPFLINCQYKKDLIFFTPNLEVIYSIENELFVDFKSFSDEVFFLIRGQNSQVNKKSLIKKPLPPYSVNGIPY